MRVSAISCQQSALNYAVSHKGVKGALIGCVATISMFCGAAYCAMGSETFKKCDPSLMIGSALLGTFGGGFGHFYENYRKHEKTIPKNSK